MNNALKFTDSGSVGLEVRAIGERDGLQWLAFRSATPAWHSRRRARAHLQAVRADDNTPGASTAHRVGSDTKTLVTCSRADRP